MTTFSWTDSIHAAFSTCFPCFSNSRYALSSPSDDSLIGQGYNPHDPTVNRVQRARTDELQGLLADADTLDTDTEAERMSLHSNPGLGTNRKKRTKRKKGKKITFFGYDLFGKPVPPPIRLPDEDHLGIESHTRSRTHSQRSTISASTLDSDAAPLELDPATIARISELELAQRAAQAIEAERLKQERHQKRKEKKRMAKALALAHADPSEFEGFQGSGGDLPPVYSYSESETPSQDREHDGYGPFVRAPYREGDDDAEADAADFDGALYTRKRSDGQSGSRSGSDSRSRTSASRAQTDAHRHDLLTALSPPTSPLADNHKSSLSSSSDKVQSTSKPKSKSKSSATSSTQSESTPSLPPPTPKSKSRSKSKPKSRSTTSGASHTSTTQSSSPSLASPSSAFFPNPDPNPDIDPKSTSALIVPAIPEDGFDGTPGFESESHNQNHDHIVSVPTPAPEFHNDDDDEVPNPGFPSKGFSRGRSGFPSQGFPSSGLFNTARVGSSGRGSGKADTGMGMERDKKKTDSVHALGGAFLATRGDDDAGGRREGGL